MTDEAVIRQVAGRALEILGERGWAQGLDTGVGGEVCAGKAIQLAAIELSRSQPCAAWTVYWDTCRAFEVSVGLSGDWHPGQNGTIATWNDRPERILCDVEEALAKLAGEAVPI